MGVMLPVKSKEKVKDYGIGSLSEPEVRRMRLKPEDVFVIIGSSGLWSCLSPDEAVEIVGRQLHRMAADASAALQTAATKRMLPGTAAKDLTVIVIYLAGG